MEKNLQDQIDKSPPAGDESIEYGADAVEKSLEEKLTEELLKQHSEKL